MILFRESVYHLPLGKVKRVLEDYAKYLKPAGVLIVRTCGETIKHHQKTMLRIMEREFAVIEKSHYPEDRDSVVIVFRLRRPC